MTGYHTRSTSTLDFENFVVRIPGEFLVKFDSMEFFRMLEVIIFKLSKGISRIIEEPYFQNYCPSKMSKTGWSGFRTTFQS